MNGKRFFSHGLILLCVVLLACSGTGQRAEIEKLTAQVTSLHDEVMPLMGPLYKTRKRLLLQAEADSSNVQLVNAILNIKSAEEEMMKWMRNYDPGFEGANDSETMKYFSDQKKSIEQVSASMNQAMANGKSILNRRP